MADIDILDRVTTPDNPWSAPAENPFYAGSILHPNVSGPYTVHWTIRGFPPIGAAFLFGKCRIGDPARTATTLLTVDVRQGPRHVSRRFRLGNGHANRFGVAFVNDGEHYDVSFTVEVKAEADLAGSVLEVEPLSCMQPIGESVRPILHCVLEGGAGSLVSCNQGGLMNRLVPLMSILYVGRRANRSVYAWWGANDHCAAELPDLFDLSQTEVDASFIAEDFTIYSNYETTAPLDLSAVDGNVLIHSILPIRTTSPELPNDHDTAALEFRKVRLAEPVRRKIAPFDDEDFSNTIGFHIRRPYPNGTFAEQERSKFTLSPEVFVDLIGKLQRELPEFRRVLLCTNSLELEDNFKRIFDDYIFTYQKTSIDNTMNPVAVQEALVDLTLMSRCPLLFSQETTAFGLFAHAVGRNKLFCITGQTNARDYQFYRFDRARHILTFASPRDDITELLRQVRD